MIVFTFPDAGPDAIEASKEAVAQLGSTLGRHDVSCKKEWNFPIGGSTVSIVVTSPVGESGVDVGKMVRYAIEMLELVEKHEKAATPLGRIMTAKGNTVSS